MSKKETNSGRYNSGGHNSGDCNSGYSNTGSYNSGNRNSGDCNSGHYNSGSYNSGNRNSGDCNTDSPTVRLFNKDSGWDFNNESHLKFKRIIRSYQKLKCEWVYEKNMTNEEKSSNKSYKTTGGYLKVNESTYNGKEVSKEDREFLESVPNFDAAILEETTGIVFDTDKSIVIDGKEFKISKESFEQFKKQFK